MRLVILSVSILSILAINSFVKQTAAAEATAAVVPVEHWSCLFGDQEAKLHFRIMKIKTDPGVDGRIQWQYSANQRTLDRGEFQIGRKDRGQAEITLRLPKLRAGVIFKTELTVAYVPRGENVEAAALTKTLWLFPEDPFADQRSTLEKRELTLFDPEGQTAELFEKIELPHQRIRNVAALGDPADHSYLIVGEGTSLTRNRGLAERLLSFAAAGGTVLMLAPSEGTIPMPGEDDAPKPGGLKFRQHDIIREFDKRLDPKLLPGISDFAGSKVSLRTRLSRIGMQVSEDGDWPWFTVEYPETRGRFVFCGFSLIEHWDAGPTPRFLLDRILTPRSDR